MPELYDYQRTGMHWLADRRRGYLADDMGLGKTPQAVSAAAYLGVSSVLVICPASVRAVWAREIEKWDPHGREWHVVSYDQLARWVQTGTEPPAHELLIVDEAHYAKSPTAKRSRFSLRLANRAPRVWFLSGTPMPNNNPAEMYTIFRAVWPDLMPAKAKTYEGWLNLFCRYSVGHYNNIQVHGAKNVPLFRSLLDQIMLRRMPDDVEVDLPDLRYEEMMVPLSDESRELVAAAEAEVDTGMVLAALRTGTSAVPGTSRLRHILGVEKARALAPVLREELESSPPERKLVVLAYHREALALLEMELQDFDVAYMDGGTPEKQRTAEIERFQTDPHTRVFLGQLTTAGIGVTLHAASEVVLVEPSWSPADNQQAIKRIHRIGQDRPCRARMAFVPNSLDDKVQRVLSRKLKMAGEVVHSYGTED